MSDDASAPTPAASPGGAAPDERGADLARSMLARARADARNALRQPKRRARTQGPTSGARPDDRDPQPLGRSVDRLLSERGWEATASVAAVTGRWDEIVGADVARHCTPDGFADGVLVVQCDSSVWATQLRHMAADLVRRLNAEVGQGTVTRVEVRAPGGPSWRKGALRVQGRGPRDTYG
jgi:predicted nucleic acid-binding Zn ribbon protein